MLPISNGHDDTALVGVRLVILAVGPWQHTEWCRIEPQDILIGGSAKSCALNASLDIGSL